MTKEQKEIAERVAELLAQSTIDADLKEMIVEKFDRLPEYLVLELLDALETENDQLDLVVSKIDEFIDGQEAGWQDVENEQKNFAEKFLEDASQTLDDQARIKELKEAI